MDKDHAINPFVTMLRIIVTLCTAPATAVELQAQFDISRATLMRYISEARALGAKIEAVQSRRQWAFELRNAGEVQTRARRWLELEEAQDLRRVQPVLPGLQA